MFSLCVLTHLGDLRVHAFPPIDLGQNHGRSGPESSASMIVASTGERVHTEITEHREGAENNQRMFYSVPSPASVISVFTRFQQAISPRNGEDEPA